MRISLTYLKRYQIVFQFNENEETENFCHKINDLEVCAKRRLKEVNNNVFVCVAKQIAKALLFSKKYRYEFSAQQHFYDFLLEKVGELDGSRGIKLLKIDGIEEDINFEVEILSKKV